MEQEGNEIQLNNKDLGEFAKHSTIYTLCYCYHIGTIFCHRCLRVFPICYADDPIRTIRRCANPFGGIVFFSKMSVDASYDTTKPHWKKQSQIIIIFNLK